MGKIYHVVPYKSNQWAIKTSGNSRFLSVHDSKTEAIDIAREKLGTTLVHSPTGVILQPVIVKNVDMNTIRQAVGKVGDGKHNRVVLKRTKEAKSSKK